VVGALVGWLVGWPAEVDDLVVFVEDADVDEGDDLPS
jgi:beta-lactamase class D